MYNIILYYIRDDRAEWINTSRIHIASRVEMKIGRYRLYTAEVANYRHNSTKVRYEFIKCIFFVPLYVLVQFRFIKDDKERQNSNKLSARNNCENFIKSVDILTHRKQYF